MLYITLSDKPVMTMEPDTLVLGGKIEDGVNLAWGIPTLMDRLRESWLQGEAILAEDQP